MFIPEEKSLKSLEKKNERKDQIKPILNKTFPDGLKVSEIRLARGKSFPRDSQKQGIY